MVVGEGQRRVLHERLVEVLGVDDADVLMEYLPPSGWGDVARRSDLDHLEQILRTEMSSMETRLLSTFDSFGGELRGEMAKQSRTVIVSSSVMVVSVVGTLIAALVTLAH